MDLILTKINIRILQTKDLDSEPNYLFKKSFFFYIEKKSYDIRREVDGKKKIRKIKPVNLQLSLNIKINSKQYTLSAAKKNE